MQIHGDTDGYVAPRAFVPDPERDWSPLPGADLITYRVELGS